MVKVSVNRFVERRIQATRRTVETNTLKIRRKALKNLKEIFEAASKMAGGEIKHQRIDGKMVPVRLQQRWAWLEIAKCAAYTIKDIASNINEEKIYAQLNELERLLKDAKKAGKKEMTLQDKPESALP